MMIFNIHAAIMTGCVVAAAAIIRWCYTVMKELEAEEKARKARARARVVNAFKEIEEKENA